MEPLPQEDPLQASVEASNGPTHVENKPFLDEKTGPQQSNKHSEAAAKPCTEASSPKDPIEPPSLEIKEEQNSGPMADAPLAAYAPGQQQADPQAEGVAAAPQELEDMSESEKVSAFSRILYPEGPREPLHLYLRVLMVMDHPDDATPPFKRLTDIVRHPEADGDGRFGRGKHARAGWRAAVAVILYMLREMELRFRTESLRSRSEIATMSEIAGTLSESDRNLFCALLFSKKAVLTETYEFAKGADRKQVKLPAWYEVTENDKTWMAAAWGTGYVDRELERQLSQEQELEKQYIQDFEDDLCRRCRFDRRRKRRRQ